MPIHEYRCPACDATFEELVRSASDARRIACPKCGERNVTRLPSVFSAHDAPAKRPARPGACGSCRGSNGSCPMAE